VTLAEEALRVNPAQHRTLGLLAIYYAGLGDTANARRALEKLAVDDADDPDPMIDAAVACALLGDHDAAIRWARRAVQAGYDVDEVRLDPDLRLIPFDSLTTQQEK
jgi:Flp pilus assembly protein TadD